LTVHKAAGSLIPQAFRRARDVEKLRTAEDKWTSQKSSSRYSSRPAQGGVSLEAFGRLHNRAY